MLMELNTKGRDQEKTRQKEKDPKDMTLKMKCAKGSTVKEDVDSMKTSVTTDTSARDVEKEGMENLPTPWIRISEDIHGMRPKYLHYNIWDPDSNFSPNTAD